MKCTLRSPTAPSERLLKRLARLDVLAVDEFGYLNLKLGARPKHWLTAIVSGVGAGSTRRGRKVSTRIGPRAVIELPDKTL